MAFQVTEVQKALKGADYPMDGAALSKLAEKNGADDDLVDALKGLREVDGPNTVMQELKGSLGSPTPGGNSKDEKRYKDVEGPSFLRPPAGGPVGMSFSGPYSWPLGFRGASPVSSAITLNFPPPAFSTSPT